MPAPGKQSPSSPATSPHPGGPVSVHPAVAARIRQLAAHAEHRHAIAQFRDDHAADQQSTATPWRRQGRAATDAISGEQLILTAGGIDSIDTIDEMWQATGGLPERA
jgi:hypothetical protein